MIFFSSRSQMLLWKLHEPIQIFIDGYHKVPKPFVQLVTVMGYFPDLKKAVPIISCLVTKKTKDAYQRMFFRMDAIIREEFQEQKKILNPKIVTIDFELALIGAVGSCWPEAQIQGCFVHFLRAQITNLKKLGLMKNENKRKNYQLITLISVLAFMDPSKIKNVFYSIKNSPHFCEYEIYFTYFQDVWLNGNYPTEMWNSFNKVLNKTEYCEKLKHSNNTIESFHSLLNFILQKTSHPTMVEFAQAMKDMEGIAKTNINYYQDKAIIKVITFRFLMTTLIGNRIYQRLCQEIAAKDQNNFFKQRNFD